MSKQYIQKTIPFSTECNSTIYIISIDNKYNSILLGTILKVYLRFMSYIYMLLSCLSLDQCVLCICVYLCVHVEIQQSKIDDISLVVDCVKYICKYIIYICIILKSTAAKRKRRNRSGTTAFVTNRNCTPFAFQYVSIIRAKMSPSIPTTNSPQKYSHLMRKNTFVVFRFGGFFFIFSTICSYT